MKNHVYLYFHPVNIEAAKDLAARIRNDKAHCTLINGHMLQNLGRSDINHNADAIVLDTQLGGNVDRVINAFKRYDIPCEVHLVTCTESGYEFNKAEQVQDKADAGTSGSPDSGEAEEAEAPGAAPEPDTTGTDYPSPAHAGPDYEGDDPREEG
jgi:hypothetical protein